MKFEIAMTSSAPIQIWGTINSGVFAESLLKVVCVDALKVDEEEVFNNPAAFCVEKPRPLTPVRRTSDKECTFAVHVTLSGVSVEGRDPDKISSALTALENLVKETLDGIQLDKDEESAEIQSFCIIETDEPFEFERNPFSMRSLTALESKPVWSTVS